MIRIKCNEFPEKSEFPSKSVKWAPASLMKANCKLKTAEIELFFEKANLGWKMELTPET